MFGMLARPRYRRGLAAFARIEILNGESQLGSNEVRRIDRTLVGGVVRAVAALHAATVLVGLEGTVRIADIDLRFADGLDPIGGIAGDIYAGCVVQIRGPCAAKDRPKALAVGTVAVANL